MSKSTSAARFVPIALVGLVIVCGCFVLGAAVLFFNYQSSNRNALSIPLHQSPVLPQLSAPTQIVVTPAQTKVPGQSVQHVPEYSDFLGKDQYAPAFLDMSQIYCGMGQYDWVCPTLGIEFSDSQGDQIVDHVWIYSGGYANFDEYKGEMPNGLAWDDTYNDVISKLGQPDSFLNYGWIYTKFGIGIYYQTDAPSAPDPSETIQYILISLP